MNVLFDALHPAHVLMFRHAAAELRARGHEVMIAARRKDVTVDLLTASGLPYRVITAAPRRKAALPAEWGTRLVRTARLARAMAADVLVGAMGPVIAPVGRLLGLPSVVFYDTEIAWPTNLLVQALCSAFVTPRCYAAPVRGPHVIYDGYKELAYLHPRRFTPELAVLDEAGVRPPFAVVRLVSFGASHDIGARGLRDPAAAIAELERHARVLVSSEAPLPPRFERNRIRVAPERFHHLLAQASLYLGESPTVAAEAACLGVPAIYVGTSRRGYIDDLELRHRLAFHHRDQPAALALAADLLGGRGGAEQWPARRQRMLDGSVDLTEWMVRFIEGRGWERPAGEPDAPPTRPDAAAGPSTRASVRDDRPGLRHGR